MCISPIPANCGWMLQCAGQPTKRQEMLMFLSCLLNARYLLACCAISGFPPSPCLVVVDANVHPHNARSCYFIYTGREGLSFAPCPSAIAVPIVGTQRKPSFQDIGLLDVVCCGCSCAPFCRHFWVAILRKSDKWSDQKDKNLASSAGST